MNPTITLITSPTPAAIGAVTYARILAADIGGNLRAPHHTATTHGLSEEMARAAGGVLLIDDPASFSPAAVYKIASLWVEMRASVRPRIVMILRGGHLNYSDGLASDMKRCATLFDGWNIADHRSMP